MSIVFDDGVAQALRRELVELGDGLRSQSGSRRSLAEMVMRDFAGVYAELFWQGRMVEYEDRMRLAGVLEDLSEQVEVNRRRAEEEQARLAEREKLVRKLSDGAVWYSDGVAMPFDFSEDWLPGDSDPIPPVPLSVGFMARERPRSSGVGGVSGVGRSSADPVVLRDFMAQMQGLDAGFRDAVARLRVAWAQFTSSCSWVPADDVNFFSGFNTLILENEQDALWVGRIAEAFEQAGGGVLMDVVIAAAANSEFSQSLNKLLRPGLSYEEVAKAWQDLGWGEAEIRSMSLGLQYVLSTMNGIPASVRNTASRAVLKAGIGNPKRVYELMGVTGMSLDEFTSQIQGLQNDVADADRMAKTNMRGSDNKVAQLLGLSFQEDRILTAVSLGNLDTASNVTINVPGATTDVTGMGTNLRAVNELLIAAQDQNTTDSFAGVAWLGYRAPSFGEVSSSNRAQVGGVRLAGFIDNMYATRGEGNAPGRVTVAGHSYGSTTSWYGLAMAQNRVDAFVNYGSVGFPLGSSAQDVNAEKVYTTVAPDDNAVALGFGVNGLQSITGYTTYRIDPRLVGGVEEITAQAQPGDGGKTVTGHDMYPDDPNQVGYFSPESASLKEITKIVSGKHQD